MSCNTEYFLIFTFIHRRIYRVITRPFILSISKWIDILLLYKLMPSTLTKNESIIGSIKYSLIIHPLADRRNLDIISSWSESKWDSSSGLRRRSNILWVHPGCVDSPHFVFVMLLIKNKVLYTNFGNTWDKEINDT